MRGWLCIWFCASKDEASDEEADVDENVEDVEERDEPLPVRGGVMGKPFAFADRSRSRSPGWWLRKWACAFEFDMAVGFLLLLLLLFLEVLLSLSRRRAMGATVGAGASFMKAARERRIVVALRMVA